MSELKGNVKHHGGCYAFLCVVGTCLTGFFNALKMTPCHVVHTAKIRKIQGIFSVP